MSRFWSFEIPFQIQPISFERIRVSYYLDSAYSLATENASRIFIGIVSFQYSVSLSELQSEYPDGKFVQVIDTPEADSVSEFTTHAAVYARMSSPHFCKWHTDVYKARCHVAKKARY